MLISEHGDGEIVARVRHAPRVHDRPRLHDRARPRGHCARWTERCACRSRRRRHAGRAARARRDSSRRDALVAAHRAQAPIVLVGVAVDRGWYVESWDRFCIPRPFARIGVAYSEPYYLESATARDAASSARAFGERLDAMDAAAQRAIARRVEAPVPPPQRAD